MRLLKYMTLALVAGLLLYGTGAAADDIFQTAFQAAVAVFKNVRAIVYVIGGFGLIGLSVAAMMGKMQFKWLVYIALGLAIVAAADLIITFATDTAVRSPSSATIKLSSTAIANEMRDGSSGSSERNTSNDDYVNGNMRVGNTGMTYNEIAEQYGD